MTELLRTSHTMTLAWRYGTGWYFAEFIRALRDERRILGLRCPVCQRVYLPPRPVCGNCYAELREWVEVKDTGTVRAFTVVHTPIIDPATGQPRPTPYGMALIQLDGADTTLNHYLADNDPATLRARIGMRVRAVWRQERKGALSDIVHFAEMNNGATPELAPGASVNNGFISAGVNLAFSYAAGEAASRFLIALRDEKKIYGTRCAACGRVLVPARSFCPRCFVDTAEWIEVGPAGIVAALAPVSRLQGAPTALPIGLIRLDGADTALLHFVGESRPESIRLGLRVTAVFAELRIGSILDLDYFQPA